MKKLSLLYSLLLVWGIANAQDTIRVAPDYTNGGALNKAIELNGPNKVYLLEVNGFYDLNKSIEFLRPVDKPNAWYHIVGEKPKNPGDFMPIIQTGLTATNVPFEQMFSIKADVSFKNIFIANQAVNGQLGKFTFIIREKVRFGLDGCVVDPVGVTDLVNGGEFSRGSEVYLTNNLVLRQGDKYSPNGGHTLRDVYADTLYIENNTFVSTDNGLVAGGGIEESKKVNFLWFNHNTVVFHDVSLIANAYLPKTYVTNNLFYDMCTFVQQHSWASIDTDFGKSGTYFSQIKTDTAYVNGQLEPLPSNRTHFWNRNLYFVSKAVQDTLLNAAVNNPTGNQFWQIPIIWNADVPHYFVTDWAAKGQAILAASREAKMFNSSDFPNFREANTLYDVNPNFVDTRIAEFSKEVASSALYWYRTNKLLPGTNPANQKSQFWDVDAWAGTSAAMYPAVWPRWNGKYTNPLLLTASNAGLPLGDLNAFPEAKALWEKNKDRIADHIKSLSTEKMNLTGLKSNKMENSIQIFPNPMKDYVKIEAVNPISSVKIYNVAGKLVKEVNVLNTKLVINVSDLNKGTYLVEAILVSGGKFSKNLVK
jgi:hypothetical protein